MSATLSCRGAAFEVSGKNLQLPDDMVVGAIVGTCSAIMSISTASYLPTAQLNPSGAVLGYELTEIPAMNSHLNRLARIQPDTLKDQVLSSFKFKGTKCS